MKRKLRMFLPLVCAAILLMGMTAMAAGSVGQCSTCEAYFVSQAREAGHWEVKHMVGTGYFLNGVEITEECTIQYVKTEVVTYCPNGHGVPVHFVQTDEYHTSEHCIDRHY